VFAGHHVQFFLEKKLGKRLPMMSTCIWKQIGEGHGMDDGRGVSPSLAAIAEAAGVSKATVSRIVNGHTNRAAPDTVQRVMRLVESSGYRPNHAGRSLRRRESQIVAMLAPNIDNPAMAAIAASTEAALREAGYVMILCDTHDRADLQDEYLEAMRAQMARGYVLVSAVKSPGLEAALRRGDPLVFVNRRNPFGEGSFIGIDNLGAGADAAEHLLQSGATRLAALCPRDASSTIAERIEGFATRCRQAGHEPAIAHGSGGNHLAIGDSAIRNLVADRDWPEALFCPSDLMAYAAFSLAEERGKRIPDDCRIVSIDGNVLTRWLAPRLATITVPYVAFGGVVVEELERHWRGEAPTITLLPHTLPAPAASAAPRLVRRR
jgi:LacI family transcriptional regulator